jgi:hypothetical protein
MSDAGGPAGPGGPGGPGVPEYTPEPPERGLWARFLASPTWVKIALPVAVVILAVLAGVLIAQAGDNSSDEDETEELLEEIAEELADEEAATTTTIPVTLPSTTTVAETTTTVEETTTTIAETTTTAVATTTTVPATTTTVPVAPTTTTTTTTTTTVPATTTTSTTTTTEPPPTEAPPTTEAPPDTEPPDTEAPDTEPPDTEPSDTEAPDTEPPDTEPGLPPEALFGSLDDLQSAWNATAQGTSVAPVDSWTPTTVLDRAVNVANLGGNLRLAAVANDDGFVTHVVLAWLPLADDAEQPQQNAQFQDAFAVLVRTVNPGASSSQQAGLAADLGISAEQPPFPEGAEARAALPPDRYQLKVVDIPSQDGPTTLIAATSAR